MGMAVHSVNVYNDYTYLTRQGQCVVDIEEYDCVLDRTLVKRWVD
jgi:hypothetical protein